MDMIAASMLIASLVLTATSFTMLLMRGGSDMGRPIDASMEQLVHEALDNAVVNGHYATRVEAYHVGDIAEDLIDCCATFEGVNPYDLEPHVRSWLTKNR